MRVVIPHQKTPWLEGRGEQVDRSWFQWLRQFWWASGLAKEVPMYGDLWVPALSMSTAASNQSFATNLEAVAFPDAASTVAFFSARLPNNYREGTDVEWYFEWMPLTSAAGDTVWVAYHDEAADGEAFDATTDAVPTSTAPGVALQVTRKTLTAIDGDNLVKGSHIFGQVGRAGADAADTMATTAMLLGVGFKYQLDGAGWEEAHP